ncbi:30S ribosomal protein S17 [Candidatus Woesearchaeota archaeon]|nr:30S ribosomal protein S17 [Candidatus Woesearchaeota archaeon]
MNAKNVGLKVPEPKAACKDRHCPFHGSLKVRGRTFTGKVIKSGMHKTVTVEWPRLFYIPKYERFEKRRTRMKAHNPECLKAQVGDEVKIMESRPISKTKNFVIIEVIKNESDTG